MHPERSGNPDPATEETTVPLAVAKMCGFVPKPQSPSIRFSAGSRGERMRKQREIVVRTEGFGGGPGMGWWKEARFVEVDRSTIEVFRATDQRERPRETRTLSGPLGWRTVARYVAGII
jgi:hypothetical protein